MDCFYWKGNTRMNSPKEMIELFLSERVVLSGDIFSSEEVQKNVKDKILSLHVSKDAYASAEYVTDIDFISRINTDIFSPIPELKGIDRLTPEYIESNRMKNFVLKKMEGKTSDDAKKGVIIDNNNFVKLMEYSEFQEYDQDLIKTMLSEYEEVISIENATKNFAATLNSMIYASVNNAGIDAVRKIFDDFYSLESSSEIFGDDTPERKRAWFDRMHSIIKTIETKVSEKGLVLSQLKVLSTPAKYDINNQLRHSDVPRVKSSLDLVAVDSKGVVHIFEIKTSKHIYSQWDSAKKLTSDWSLAIKRQLLGQAINIDKVALYVIPISVPRLKDPTAVNVGDFEARTNNQHTGLRQNGYINIVSDKLIPRKIFAEYDFERITKLKARLGQVIDEAYEIRTEVDENNTDAIVKKAAKNFEKNDYTYQFHNSFEGINQVPKGYVIVTPKDLTEQGKADALAEFTNLVERYVAFVKIQGDRSVSMIYDAINHSISANEKVKISRHSERLQHILNEYLNKDWETVEIKEGIPMGIIVLRNRKTGVINIFNMSADQFKAPVKESGFKESMDDYTYRDLDIIKAMIFIDEFKKDLLPNSAYKLGQLISFNPKNGANYYTPMTEALEIYKNRMVKKGLDKEINIHQSDLMAIEDVALHDVNTMFRNYDGAHKERLKGIAAMLGDGHLENIDKERLIAVRDAFLKEFPDYINKTADPKLDFDDHLGVIFALIQTAILTKSGVELHGDFRDLTKYSFQYADFKSLITGLYTHNVEQYDKLGNKIQGLFQGLVWSSPEFIQSKDLRQINDMAATGNSVIGQKFLKVNEKIRPLTKAYYESIHYNMAQRMVIGESQSKYKNLYLANNKYTTKNPYKTDPENILEENESNYLKHMLLLINQYVVGISDEEIAKIDPMNIESLRSNEKIARLLDSGEYFEMPLMRREEMSKYEGAFKINGDDLNFKGMVMDNVRSWVDGRELSKHDLLNTNETSKGFFEMYDPYKRQRGETRARMLADSASSYFEMNLDTIAHKVAFTKIRKQTFDLILPVMNAYIWWIKLVGARNDVKVDKQVEYIINQVKLAVLDQPIIGDEEATIVKGASFVKQFSTVSMLAFRPALLVKEMTIGIMRNFSASALNINEEFNAADMAKAYGKLITIDNKFSDEFNMITKLNHLYRMGNMDISTMSKKVQADRWGIMKGAGRYMFMTSTLGDYYNRMAILLAKMIHEGSYDAHTMVDGNLRYDPRKDDRFKYYLAERSKHKDADGNYIAKKGDHEYNLQRRRYLLTISQMNKEGELTNEKKLTEDSIIEKAYTHQERNSIKSYGDLMYGAYDKDSMAHVNNTLAGIAFMQFLTYWPNKIKFWFGKRIEGEDSSLGTVKQATQGEGENKQLLWNEEYIDDEGRKKLRLTTTNTGDPALAFEGTPQEGIFTAMLYTVQNIMRGDFAAIKNDKLRNSRAMFGLVDGALMVLILGIMAEIWKALNADEERGTVSGELINFMGAVNEKVLREYNVWENTFGALWKEPLFVSWSKRTMGSLADVVSGDETLMKAAPKMLGAAEFLKGL